MHLLAEWVVILGFLLSDYKGSQDLSNGTNVGSYLANLFSIFTYIVYVFNEQKIEMFERSCLQKQARFICLVKFKPLKQLRSISVTDTPGSRRVKWTCSNCPRDCPSLHIQNQHHFPTKFCVTPAGNRTNGFLSELALKKTNSYGR